MPTSLSEPGGSDRPSAVVAPAITLPRGGGAIRGIDEKFAANPATGTGSVTVPIATSQGRSGFGPDLTLSYDTGAGNGPFGFGWTLSLPTITRKTDKGLPRYLDDQRSDMFIISGAEDLVPLLGVDGTLLADTTLAAGFTIHRYRPRIDGAFARIERWTRADGDVHWRSISRDNVLTVYGKDDNSRITNAGVPGQVFSWLLCEVRDDKGNAIIFEYKREDGAGLDLAQAHERNRGDRDDPRRQVNRYIKRIRYGNRVPLLDSAGKRPFHLAPPAVVNAGWMFEVVFDYGEHHAAAPQPSDDPASGNSTTWPVRRDPFSSYRAGFEMRTARLCRRVLMFHQFPTEPGVGADCLVRSTDFAYTDGPTPTDATGPVYSFLRSIEDRSYRRAAGGGYDARSLPRLEFEYIEPVIQDVVHDVDARSLENLPIGLDGAAYQWTDLHGEGVPGILTEQGAAWFYKRNLSPADPTSGEVRFAPLEQVAARPNVALDDGRSQFLDLAGDGQPDLVVLDGATPGFYEHDDGENWEPFRPFLSRLNRDTRDPNLKFVDLDGDGRPDVLITQDDAFVWHESLAEAGFGPGVRVPYALDEEQGPRLVFADGTQSIYLADVSGDGLTDLVRIRNGDVAYWPNLGYGRFGAKVSMDGAPLFDTPDQFDQQRIRVADLDGTGTTDIIYLHRDGVRLYFNQSGNAWSQPRALAVFPRVDDGTSVTAVDLLGNGTTCLVWSSPAATDAGRQMRYVDLMSGRKPHLLVRTANNFGAETRVEYATSTHFYLQDKANGTPWISRLPFPVHVVERVETYDYIGRNRFVTRYAYHHGHFDGDEREFRGFGMVEQWDTELFASLSASDAFPVGDNVSAASHVPPVQTRTWFHTGVYLEQPHEAEFYAGLRDGVACRIPEGLAPDEEREAYRALKGLMLRHETYGRDGTAKAEHPYAVTQHSYDVRCLERRRGNPYAVFVTVPRETVSAVFERDPVDPRLNHTLTLEVDRFGIVLKQATLAYGRRVPNATLLLADRGVQARALVTYTESAVTNAIDDLARYPADYRAPIVCETRTYELTGYTATGDAGRFRAADFVQADPVDPTRLTHIVDAEVPYEQQPGATRTRRLIDDVRTLFRPDDLGTARNDAGALLPLGTVESLALPGEQYVLAFTPGLIAQVYQRGAQVLLPAPIDVLATDAALGADERGGYVQLDVPGAWWIPSGRIFASPVTADTAAQELAHARQHFFLPRRYCDPFHTAARSTEALVTYDAHDLLLVETRDAAGNRVSAGERLPNGTLDPAQPGNDYRLLQPWLTTDANGNRSAVVFDTLGMVVGTALMGKPGEAVGDSLDGFVADLTEAAALAHLSAPLADPHGLLQRATTRLVYDVFAYQRTKGLPNPQPVAVCTLARETHDADLGSGERTRVQQTVSYTDGFGREVQRKARAEAGPLVEGGPSLATRWVGSGWMIFNNKGKPLRQYEPFFSATSAFEFARVAGVSPILFYDATERVIATLHPNHTFAKVVFETWSRITFDTNDTCVALGDQTGDPRTDPNIRGHVEEYFKTQPPDWQTWHQKRAAGAMGADEQAAALRAAAHADTPTTTHLDPLGRPFLSEARNRFVRSGATVDEVHAARTMLDIEGNPREIRDGVVQAADAQGRLAAVYTFNMVGTRIRHSSMDAGQRWTLNDAIGKPLRSWDARGHDVAIAYDALRRPVSRRVRGTTADSDPRTLNRDLVVEQIEYGESHADAEALNLRTHVFRRSDEAGVVTNAAVNPRTGEAEAYDFKGNLLRSTRQLMPDYIGIPDWQHAPAPDAEAFVSSARYDALNRQVQSVAPHTTRAGATLSVVRHGFNEAALLERVDVWLDQASEPVGLLDVAAVAPSPAGVSNIDYDARGQRLRVDYKNGASTRFSYDRETFRLTDCYTRRGAAFTADCENPAPPPPTVAAPDAPPPATPCGLQNLHYTYDTVGNVTRIRDAAQQTIFFRNARVNPAAEFTYDALYRLIEASGREHLGQVGGEPIPHSPDDAPRVGIDWSANDGNAMGGYTERYAYDAAGNCLEMRHEGQTPQHGWTRTFTYAEASAIEDGAGGRVAKQNNRLSRSVVGGATPADRFVYDLHGNITRLPHLGGAHPTPNLDWDSRDRLRRANLGGGGTAYYVCDAAGERVRKVWEKSANLVEERIYLGNVELFRRRDAAGTVTFERETLHVMDDTRRVALVETRNVDRAGSDPAPRQLVRYQFGNHIGSSTLELDDQAQIISYEEYAPYGSTVYQAVRSRTQTPKRYRYAGKERDEETGLYDYGARYYAPWLARWISADPAPQPPGSTYEAFGSSPVVLVDPDGRKPLVANQFKNIGELRKAITITNTPGKVVRRYNPLEREVMEEYVPGQVEVTDPGGKGTNVLSEASVGQKEVEDKGVKGNFLQKAGLAFDHPELVIHQGALSEIEKLAHAAKDPKHPKAKGIRGTAIGHMSDLMFDHLQGKDRPSGRTVWIGKDKVTMADATKNMMLHVFGQALLTTLYGRDVADLSGDIHERDQPSLITGTIGSAEERQAIDNYSDMVNNLYGQDIGERMAAKFGISAGTVWTPKLTADYLNAVQTEIGKEMGWTFPTSFKETDPMVKTFTDRLNEVTAGMTPPWAVPAKPAAPAKKAVVKHK